MHLVPTHRRWMLPVLLALFLGSLFSVVPGALRADPALRLTLSEHAERHTGAYDPAHVLVELRPSADPAALADQPTTPLFANWYRVPVAAGETALAALRRLERRPEVLRAELDVLLQVDRIDPLPPAPDDPYFPFQWNLAAIGAPEAWVRSAGAGVTVAVLDTGVGSGPDLACQTFVAPYNALTQSAGAAAADDDNGHGTHVAGTIAQCTNNAAGVAGVAYEANLMPVKVCDAVGQCSLSAIAAGIDWATANGAQVINMSLGANCAGVGDGNWPNCSAAIVNAAIDAAVAADVVLVAAAGNAGQSVVGFPANHPEVIAVGAVEATNTRTTYANYGTALTLMAPGGDTGQDANGDGLFDGILQETLGRACGSPTPFTLCLFQGTSMASPHVAGAVAILRSAVPTASRYAIQNALITTALDQGDPGFDPFYGYGSIRIPAALAALDGAPPEPTPTPFPGGTDLPPALYLPLLSQ